LTTQTPATAEIVKWFRIRRKSAESCPSRLRHSRSMAISGLQQVCCVTQSESKPENCMPSSRGRSNIFRLRLRSYSQNFECWSGSKIF